MAMPPQRDHKITAADAAAMTRRAREAAPSKGAGEGERGGMFPRKPVQDLLAQKGCEGVRIYYARDEKGVPALVLVAVDKDGNDMVKDSILEWSYPCPPLCGGPNALNS
ncbi:MAG: hypothetical protein OEY20_00270 [Gemmatimonadota bacterium]|nr:hypothetical protein [Gemmatimonadota bacterium]MDH4351630.1 hypothetical protein [Gemmatimonadota bacterium]MDH5195668.1 hypothetical protein [Gemmatimonadota bacterium]